MAEEIQKIGWGESQTECETYAVPREPVLNVRASGSQGPNLFLYEEDGTTGHLFPSLGWMAEVEFAGLIGFDDTGLTSISGSTIQEALESLDGIINPDVALSLADISLTSQNTLQQTFTIKDATDVIFQSAYLVEVLSLGYSGVFIVAPESTPLEMSGNHVDIESLSGDITLTSVQTAYGVVIDCFLELTASTTSRPSLIFPAGTAPSSPVDGDMWRVGASLYLRDGGTTKSVAFT